MAKIKDYRGTKIFIHNVGGHDYSFCVNGFSEYMHDWLCEVVGSHMNDIHERATTKADKLAKAKIREALGL